MTSELAIYQRSKDFLWTNKHIAREMLTCHLDTSNDAASRNEKSIQSTIAWIHQNVPQGSSILDLGCGPGLYAERLCALGYKVFGVDISKNLIAYAKKSAQQKKLAITYSVKSYLDTSFSRSFDSELFDAAICIYCDFGALIPAEQKVFLQNVKKCVKKNGILIFDVFTETYSKMQKEDRSWYYTSKKDFWSEKPHHVLNEKKFFPNENAWGSRNVVFENNTGNTTGKIREFITWDTVYDEKRITNLLTQNGFSVVESSTSILQNDDVMFVKAKNI